MVLPVSVSGKNLRVRFRSLSQRSQTDRINCKARKRCSTNLTYRHVSFFFLLWLLAFSLWLSADAVLFCQTPIANSQSSFQKIRANSRDSWNFLCVLRELCERKFCRFVKFLYLCFRKLKPNKKKEETANRRFIITT